MRSSKKYPKSETLAQEMWITLTATDGWDDNITNKRKATVLGLVYDIRKMWIHTASPDSVSIAITNMTNLQRTLGEFKNPDEF